VVAKYPPLNQYCSLVKFLLFFRRLVGDQDVSMAESLESKLDAIMNVLASLSHRTAEIEEVMVGLHSDGASGIAPSRVY